MDWPVIGAVSAVAIVAGAVTYEAAVLMQSDAGKRAPRVASHETPVERSAYEIPGFATGKPAEWTPSFPLIPLIDPDAAPAPESAAPARQPPARNPAPKQPAAAPVPAKPPAAAEASKAPPPAEVKAANPAPAAPAEPPRVEQWRVVVTAKASYFNLGGHVDRAGIVDSLASSHLRDALKSHRNFPQLPPDIRNHILTQNINLAKLAPYRGLVGMNDKALEEEQAVRIEKIASRRTAFEASWKMHGMVWRSLGESNPCFSLERAAS